MSKLVSKCGMDCGTCPLGPYPRQNMTAEEFEQYRKGAKEILGQMPMKTPCPTCQTPNAKIPKGSKLPPRSCLVRQCVDKNGVENCAFCSRFPCEHAKAHARTHWNRQKIEEKIGQPISEENYHAYVEPFETLTRLKSIRASLKPEEVVEAAKISPIKTKVEGFPQRLNLSQKETAALRALHRLLTNIKHSTLGLKDTDLFAQNQILKNRIPHFLRFLWIFGLFGDLKVEDETHLVVEAKTYIDNRGSEKTLATWPFVKDVIIKILTEFGVHCKRVMLKGIKEKDLTTPGGIMRSKGWTMMMTFDENAGGIAALKALQIYAKKLDEKHGKKAFRYFRNVNMQVLG